MIKISEEKNVALVKNWLPELSMEDKQNASQESGWAKMFIATYRPGDFHTMPAGVTLQAITHDIVRCVRIFNSQGSWWCLSMLKETFENAEITLQLDPYTIVTQVTEKAEGEHPNSEKYADTEDESAERVPESDWVEVV